MAETANRGALGAVPSEPSRFKEKAVASGVIGMHTFEHIYTRGFIVLLPEITDTLGLSSIFAAIIDAARQLASGLISVISGILVDMYQHRRGQFLAIAMLMLGLGYFAVSVVDAIYGLIIVAVMVGSAGSGLWHPPALGLLAERFPQKRGLVIALHRSTGSLGDSIGPVIVGAMLTVMIWQDVVKFGLPLMLLLVVIIVLFLRHTGAPSAISGAFWKRLGSQFKITGQSFTGRGMMLIMLVSAIRGMGDRALILYLPFFIKEDLGLGNIAVGIHVGLLAAMGIILGPIIGLMSDRTGRKPLIVGIMLVSSALTVTMVITGSVIALTISLVLFGFFFFSVNSLTQAAAVDLTEGKRLEGTAIGLMWGNNALFGAISPVLAGALAEFWGFEAAFYYAAAMFFIGFLLSLAMPGGPAYQAARARSS